MKRTTDKQNPLHWVVDSKFNKTEKIELLDLLLKSGFDIQAADKKSQTPLHLARALNNDEGQCLLKFLLKIAIEKADLKTVQTWIKGTAADAQYVTFTRSISDPHPFMYCRFSTK